MGLILMELEDQLTKILIFGGAGFLGYHLACKLNTHSENEIHIVDNLSRGVKDIYFEKLINNQSIKYFNKNLLNLNELNQLDNDYDYIYNFSAIIGVKHVLTSPFEVLTKNFIMMHNAIDFAHKQHKLKRFIFTSTSEVMAGSLEHLDLHFPTPENFPLALTDIKHPRTSYMLSKIYGEAMCYHSKLPFLIVRPHNIYGTRMGLSHVIPEIMKKIYSSKKNESIEIFNSNHQRAFCYVDDAINMIVQLATSQNKINDAVNIGNPNEEISINYLSNLIAKTMNRDDINFIFNNENNTGSPSRRVPCLKKFTEYSNFYPSISISSGCETVYSWYENNIFSGKTISSN